jgi:hypothetical protein
MAGLVPAISLRKAQLRLMIGIAGTRPGDDDGESVEMIGWRQRFGVM